MKCLYGHYDAIAGSFGEEGVKIGPRERRVIATLMALANGDRNPVTQLIADEFKSAGPLVPLSFFGETALQVRNRLREAAGGWVTNTSGEYVSVPKKVVRAAGRMILTAKEESLHTSGVGGPALLTPELALAYGLDDTTAGGSTLAGQNRASGYTNTHAGTTRSGDSADGFGSTLADSYVFERDYRELLADPPLQPEVIS
jgi:hypothetical protein